MIIFFMNVARENNSSDVRHAQYKIKLTTDQVDNDDKRNIMSVYGNNEKNEGTNEEAKEDNNNQDENLFIYGKGGKNTRWERIK